MKEKFNCSYFYCVVRIYQISLYFLSKESLHSKLLFSLFHKAPYALTAIRNNIYFNFDYCDWSNVRHKFIHYSQHYRKNPRTIPFSRQIADMVPYSAFSHRVPNWLFSDKMWDLFNTYPSHTGCQVWFQQNLTHGREVTSHFQMWP